MSCPCGTSPYRAIFFGLAFLFCDRVSQPLRADELRDAVRNGLRWYDTWIQDPTAPSQSPTKCFGQRFEDSAFLYCSPGQVVLEADVDPAQKVFGFRMIGTTPLDYKSALAEYMSLPSRRGSPSKAIQYMFEKRELEACAPNSEVTERFISALTDFFSRYRSSGQSKPEGRELLFPWACSEDPFYQVYEVRTGIVDTIWEFRVIGGAIQGFPHWTYDRPHRNIPPRAALLVKESSRWYKSMHASVPALR